MSINLNNLARSEGAAKTSMIALSCGAILNIILDPLFIYGFDLGIKGAAIATVIAQVFTTVFLICYFRSPKSYLKISARRHTFSKTGLTEMLKIGIPTFVFQFLTCYAIGLTNVQASAFGDEAVASVGIITKLLSIGLYVVFGYTKGFQPFVGYNYGANNLKRVKEAIRFSLQITTIFCALIAATCILFSKTIIGWFSQSEAIIDIGARGLIASSVFFVTFGFQMIFITLFLALGKGKEGAILSLLRQGICLIPVLFILPGIIGLDGVLFAQGIADFLTAGITAVFAMKFYRHLKQREEGI
jgi:putative MATE family efflux protein